ncbi:MAG: hypothetical protein EP298_04845 [Gammaproteobacteria bacterium]|nr:MAG: hypothetical protein EP298_04845 [Gammaproteobacteria bacterium]UTW42543.1 UvrD-helicase domain-containing protein [bacterium SCSIO 12844]
MDIIDQAQRQKALDISQSFIVQAPAGSGKTELLSQRFLTLLSAVKKPESIIAITFTNKAQSEMHRRIIEALSLAKANKIPLDKHKKKTYDLAQKVLLQDQKYNWQLLENPNRLSITTIDALSLKLTMMMPERSQFLTNVEIAQDINTIYRQAIDMMLEEINLQHPKYQQLNNVLNHLDNNLTQFYDLIIRMLIIREQWLQALVNANEQLRKSTLENNFAQIIKTYLTELYQYLEPYHDDLEDLSSYAAKNLAIDMENQKLSVDLDNLKRWQFLINHLLITKDNTLKKRLTKNDGFPTSSTKKDEKAHQKQQKSKLLDILSVLGESDDVNRLIELCTDLKSISLIYDPSQWQILTDIIDILLLSAQYLYLKFSQSHKVDFSEVAIKAITALGYKDDPTDLMLYLDYAIEHLLVDEFQDTSKLQYELIKSLTCGWQQGDGRSLFLVGDPMQSIYRFRQAEVELFLNAKDGIGDLLLTPLYLQCNFRSDKTIIDWVNHTFRQIFPKVDQKAFGAISYHPSEAVFQHQQQSNISLVSIANDHREAEKIIEIIKQHQVTSPKITIGILARSRNHLNQIIQQLKLANIPYNETEIESLYHLAVIEDLLALLEVILSPAEKLSLTKLLTSRLFGIDFNRIELLLKEFDESSYHSISYYLFNSTITDLTLSDHFKDQLLMLNKAINERFKLPLSIVLHNLWLSLNGPSYYPKNQLDEIEKFFELLSSFEDCGHLIDKQAFYQQLKTLRSSKCSDASIDVMTIHKAKGLEFDIVILPGLNKAPKANDHQLLNYDYYHDDNHQFRLLLASKAHRWQKHANAFYQLITDNNNRRLAYETDRLLYVAATRAKSYLYCFAAFDIDHVKANKRSFFSSLYPATANHWQADQSNKELSQINHQNQIFQRKLLQAIKPPTLIPLDHDNLNENNLPEPFDIFKLEGQILGNTIHYLLEQLIKQQAWLAYPNETYLNHLITTQLHLAGIEKTQALILKEIIHQAVGNTLNNKKLNQYFSQAKQIFCEYSLYHIAPTFKEKLQKSIIDLLVIDKQNNIVIIDYKTTHYNNDNNDSLDRFISDEINQHKDQIKRYHYLIREHLSNQSIKTFLYFPILDHLESISI